MSSKILKRVLCVVMVGCIMAATAFIPWPQATGEVDKYEMMPPAPHCIFEDDEHDD